MPKILESEALVLANSIDAAAPEDRPWMLDVLTRYQSQQFDNGDPEWPTQAKQQAEAETRFRSMFDAPEKVPYDPGPYAKDPNAERASYANAAFIANRYNVEFGEAVDRRRFYMDDYAAKKGQKSGLDDMAFYKLASAEVAAMQRKENAFLEGSRAALRGENVISSLQGWQWKNLDMMEDSSQFTQGFLRAQEKAGDMIPLADKLLKLLESGTGKSNSTRVFDADAAKELDDMTAELATMKPRERKEVYASIAARVEAAGYDQKGFWSQMLGQIDQGIFRMSSTLGTQAGTATDVMRNFPAMLAEGATGNRDFGMTSGDVASTDVSIAQRQALGEVQSEVAQIISGTVDPVKTTVGWIPDYLEAGAIKGPGAVLPFMTASAALGPYGAGLVFTADFAEQNRRDLVAAGLDRDDAARIGVMAAPLQAAVESLSNAFQLGKWASPIGPGSSFLKRYVTNSIASGATEFTEEQVQENIIRPIVQDVVGMIDANVPQIGFGEMWGKMKSDTPELISVLAPMALVFGGVMTNADLQLSRDLTGNVDGLTALGYSSAQATEVIQAKDETGRIAKARELWGVRAGTKESMQSGAAKLSEKLRLLQSDASTAQAELERRGMLPRMLHAEEGNWRLTFNDGSVADFQTHNEANAARWSWAQDQLGEFHAITRETLASLEKNLDVGREVAVEFKPDARTAADAVKDGASREMIGRRVGQGKALGDVDAGTTYDEAMATDKAASIGDEFLSSLQILGSSKTEFLDGIMRTTIKLWEGSNVLTLVEEKLEGDAKAMMRTPQGRDWLLSRLRNYEQVSGDKVFRDVADEQLQNDDIVEAWSHVGQSYLVGRSTFGEPLQGKAMRRFGRFLMRAGLGGAFNSESAFFAAVAGRAQKLMEAKKAGTLPADFTEELERQLGIDSQVKHDTGALQELASIIDTSGYSEETPGPNGETFSTQARAKSGGEFGPNGEWYQGGAFIATTELPKKQRDKLKKMVGDGLVEVSKGNREKQTPGMFSPYRNLVGVAMGPKGNLNEDYLSNDRNNFAPGYVAQVREAVTRWSSGEMQLPISEFPLLANATDLARAIDAGVAISGEVLNRNAWAKEFVESYSPTSLSRATPADSSKVVQMPDGARLVGPVDQGATFSLARVTPAQDADYLAAVERGDMETAQRMVDEAARAAGYDTKAWHGSPDEDFTVFQKPEKEADEDGFWFSKDRDWASKFGPTRLFYIKDVKTWGGDDFVVKNPSSIKSADPITRDDAGNVIPLSQRFNPADDRITYSIASGDFAARMEAMPFKAEQDAEYLAAVQAGGMEKAQRMVDEAVRAAGYNSETLFRGRQDTGNVVSFGKDGAHFTPDREYAEGYAEGEFGNVVSGKAKIIKPLRIDLALIESDSFETFKEHLSNQGLLPSTPARLFEWSQNPKYNQTKTIGEAIDAIESDSNWADFQEDPSSSFTDNLGSAIWPLGFDAIRTLEHGNRELPVVILKSPSQIKSADPITRDADGNVIPLSQRFNPERNEITFSLRKFGPAIIPNVLNTPGPNSLVQRNSRAKPVDQGATFSLARVTPAQDADYLAAVERGDMEKAQRMVDEAAKAAGYDVGPVYHGTEQEGLTEFFGGWWSDQKATTKEFGRQMYSAFLRGPLAFAEDLRPLYVEFNGTDVDPDSDEAISVEFNGTDVDPDSDEAISDSELGDAAMSGGPFSRFVQEKGFQGIAVWDESNAVTGMAYAVFNPNQIKSADPVTRDASGNVIPLSQRFNPADNRITFSLRSGDFEARAAAMFSPFQRTPELRMAIARVAKERVFKVIPQLLELRGELNANAKERADIEIRFSEEMAMLRTDFEADEKQVRDERDFELKAVSQDKGSELDRERLRRTADKKLARLRLDYERTAAEAEKRKASELSKFDKKDNRAQRDRIKQLLRVHDALLSAIPAEVRPQVGGYVRIAELNTDEKAIAFLEDRVQKMEKVLEKWLKKEAVAEIKKLLKKGRPDSDSGKKAKGKDADMHALFAAAEAAMGMDALQVAGKLADLDARIGSGELSNDQEILAITERGLVELVGDLGNADSGRAWSALETLQDIYRGGWLKWKLAQIERRENRAGLRQALISDTGKKGIKPERDEADKVAMTMFGKGMSGLLSISSFHEVLSNAFGSKSERVTSLVDAEREASGQYEDASQNLADEVEELFSLLAGGSVLKGERLRYDMAQRTIETPKGNLSQLEAIQALLMWKQEDGQRHMEGTRNEAGEITSSWSYDQAWIDQIDAALTPEARRVMAWIVGKYGAEWQTLNPLYRERYGVNLPHHDNYAPLTVVPVQAKPGEVVDPVSGAAMSSGSILTPGSLRTRSRSAIAEPEFRDALQTLLVHSRQMEYWKAYFDLATEASAALGNRDVINSVRAKGGEESATALRKWVDALAQGGFRDASASLGMSKILSRMTGRAASVGLLGRFSTLLVQSPQLAAASVKMPVTSYLRGMSKLLTGRLGYGDAIRSKFIQRRFRSAPPIVRQALEGLGTASKPNEITRATRALGQLLSGTDALFTAGTYALLLDYHRGTGRALGLTGAELEEHAHTEAERATEQVAQPTRMATRSLAELTSTNPIAKVSWAYASEARQKIALMAWAAYKAKSEPAQFAKTAFLVFGVGGLMTQIIKNLWRDAKGDDDESKWDPARLTLRAMAAPLHGVPLASELLGDQGMLSGVQWAWPAVKDIASGEGDMRDVDTLLSVLGLFNDTAAGISSLSHTGLDAAKVVENLAE